MIVEFGGVEHEFPDDWDDSQIEGALKQYQVEQGQGAPASDSLTASAPAPVDTIAATPEPQGGDGGGGGGALGTAALGVAGLGTLAAAGYGAKQIFGKPLPPPGAPMGTGQALAKVGAKFGLKQVPILGSAIDAYDAVQDFRRLRQGAQTSGPQPLTPEQQAIHQARLKQIESSTRANTARADVLETKKKQMQRGASPNQLRRSNAQVRKAEADAARATENAKVAKEASAARVAKAKADARVSAAKAELAEMRKTHTSKGGVDPGDMRSAAAKLKKAEADARTAEANASLAERRLKRASTGKPFGKAAAAATEAAAEAAPKSTTVAQEMAAMQASNKSLAAKTAELAEKAGALVPEPIRKAAGKAAKSRAGRVVGKALTGPASKVLNMLPDFPMEVWYQLMNQQYLPGPPGSAPGQRPSSI